MVADSYRDVRSALSYMGFEMAFIRMGRVRYLLAGGTFLTLPILVRV
jgi:hypothetical protein